jgi:hypothetical protein
MNDLWERWKDHYRALGLDPSRICKDGIADEEAFNAAKNRVVFVLKESNDWPGGDLTKLMAPEPQYAVMHNVARWAFGILKDFPPFETANFRESRRWALRSVALINLKKATGGSKADLAAIHIYTRQDHELLREQLKSMKPHVIVACGTLEPLLWLLDIEVDRDNPRSRFGRERLLDAKVIPWRHPSRANPRKTYDDLRDFYRRNDEPFAKLPQEYVSS